MTLPPRPSTEVVEAALQRCSWSNETSRENILAAELLHLRETVERCREVLRYAEAEAGDWHSQARRNPDAADYPVYAFVYSELAERLEVALR